MAHHCQYEEEIREREQRGGLYENRWNTLRSRVMGYEEDRSAVKEDKRNYESGVN